MQLTINIQNNNTVEKILWMLEHFKSDGVEIIKSDDMKIQDETVYSDEHIDKNWKSMLMNIKSDSDYVKSENYKEDRGNYLMEKYK
jgi:hypothetical protein